MSVNSLREIHQYLDRHFYFAPADVTVPAAGSHVIIDDLGPGKLLYFFLTIDGATNEGSSWALLKIEVDEVVMQDYTCIFMGGNPYGHYGPDLTSWKMWDDTNKIFGGYLTFPLTYKKKLVVTITNRDATYSFVMRYRILLEKYKKVLII